jgi:hypothetical protein
MGPARSSLCFSALALCLFGAVALPAGCGNGLKSTYIPADRFPAAYAQALCTSLQHCCDENAVRFDYNACTQGWKTAIQARFADPNSSAAANYDPRVATDCVSLVSAAKNVGCGPIPASISDARATCQMIFAGKKAPGEACTADAECASVEGSTVRCAPQPGADAGGQLPLAHPLGLVEPLGASVCTATPLPDQGVPCSIGGTGGASATACDADSTLFCDPVALQCKKRSDVGGPCAPQVVTSCVAGAYCLDSGPNTGLCAAALPVGSPCKSSVECDVLATCDTSGNKCIPRLAPGTACSDDSQCSANVCDSTAKKCLKNVIATTAACTGVTK